MDDKAFWQAVYIASIRAGRSLESARIQADEGLATLKKKGFPEFPTAQIVRPPTP